MNRRHFIKTAATLSLAALEGASCATRPTAPTRSSASSADSDLIVEGARAALEKTLLPALTERAYPGHFTVSADGKSYGAQNTWPGLDGWEIAGAYLLVGKKREVLDYFDFFQASQRADGNLPFAIFPGDTAPPEIANYLRGLKFPQDAYTYKPRVRPSQPKGADLRERKWIGLFTHWQIHVNPLSVLGPISYILTASDIFAATQSKDWLAEKISSLQRAGHYLRARISSNGLMNGAGFYVESPPRNQWDGVTQCYATHAFRQLAQLNRALGKTNAAREWTRQADALRARFLEVFWRNDHFGEYVHPERGLIDTHGLSDVNWAAIGLNIATDAQCKILWPLLKAEPEFWHCGLPTQLVTRPAAYEPWEYPEPLPFAFNTPTQDVAAMGRIWYLETLACLRMDDRARLCESVLKVCESGKAHGWFWSERYHAGKDNTLTAAGVSGYCEYPAILIRTLLQNPEVFPEAAFMRG